VYREKKGGKENYNGKRTAQSLQAPFNFIQEKKKKRGTKKKGKIKGFSSSIVARHRVKRKEKEREPSGKAKAQTPFLRSMRKKIAEPAPN